MSDVIDALRKRIDAALGEYRRFRNTPYWSMHKTPVRQALEGAQRIPANLRLEAVQ